MSVAKIGRRRRRNCGVRNNDILHQAICRLYNGGITVVAAAANDSGPAPRRTCPAAYNEVITVSALADTDGKPGGARRATAATRGAATTATTRSPTSATTAPTSTSSPPANASGRRSPGRRTATRRGRSMAAPAVDRRRRAVQGEPAAGDAGRGPRGRSGTSATSAGRPRPTRTATTSSCWTCRRIRSLGSFSFGVVARRPRSRATAAPAPCRSRSPAARPSSSGSASGRRACRRAGRHRCSPDRLYGWTATDGHRSTSRSRTTRQTGHVPPAGLAARTGAARAPTTLTVQVVGATCRPPAAPTVSVLSGSSLGLTSTGRNTVTLTATWASGQGSVRSPIVALRGRSAAPTAARAARRVATSGSTRSATYSGAVVRHDATGSASGPGRGRQLEPVGDRGHDRDADGRERRRPASVSYRGRWSPLQQSRSRRTPGT